jgi:hypothetical protein
LESGLGQGVDAGFPIQRPSRPLYGHNACSARLDGPAQITLNRFSLFFFVFSFSLSKCSDLKLSDFKKYSNFEKKSVDLKFV